MKRKKIEYTKEGHEHENFEIKVLLLFLFISVLLLFCWGIIDIIKINNLEEQVLLQENCWDEMRVEKIEYDEISIHDYGSSPTENFENYEEIICYFEEDFCLIKYTEEVCE